MDGTKTETLVTAEQLARMSIQGPCELVEGRIVRSTPAGRDPGLVSSRIHSLLDAHLRAHDLGRVLSAETGFRVRRDPDTVRAPDVAFVSRATLERARAARETFFPTAPDLAVEVLSPDDSMQDVEDKVRDYLAASGKLVWVVNPKRRIVYVYSTGAPRRELGEAAEIDGGDVFPGFRSLVGAFFQ